MLRARAATSVVVLKILGLISMFDTQYWSVHLYDVTEGALECVGQLWCVLRHQNACAFYSAKFSCMPLTYLTF